MNFFTKIFAWIAGADLKLLNYCPTSSWQKFSSIGLLLAASGIFSGLSISYAVNLEINNQLLSVVCGLSFSLIILSIERNLFLSIKKNAFIDDYNSYLYKISQYIPRSLLSIIIAFTAALPAQLAIFDDIIEAHISTEQKKTNKSQERNWTESSSHTKTTLNTEDRFSLTERIVALEELSQKEPEIAYTIYLITFLFIFIYIAPINIVIFSSHLD